MIDYTTPAGQVRLKAGDIQEDNLFFTDEQLTALLAANNNDITLAAIAALDVWARALSLRPKQVIGGYQEDNTANVAAIIKVATELRKQTGNEDDDPVIMFVGGERFIAGVGPWGGY